MVKVAQKLDLAGDDLLCQHNEERNLFEGRRIRPVQIGLDVLHEGVIGHYRCGCHALPHVSFKVRTIH